MSISSSRRDAVAAQARRERLEAAETAAAQAAKDATAAAKAAAETAAALREEEQDGDEDVEGSITPKDRRRHGSPSPPRRRGHSSVVQVYREIGTGWPMLTRSNYYEWSLLMKVKLQARFLRDAIKYDGVDYEQDRRALEALCAAVPPEIGATIANKPTAKLAWEAIEARRVGSDRVRRAALQRLRGEWEGLTFCPDEQVEDFAVCLTNLMEQMVRNGDTNLDEGCAVEKFLRCMPKRYKQLVFSIETLLDLQDLSINDVAGRFKVVEDQDRVSEEQGKLLYSEQRRTGGKKGDNAGTAKDGQEQCRRPRGGRKNKPRGERKVGAGDSGGGRGEKGGDASGDRRANRDDTSNNCNRVGH